MITLYPEHVFIGILILSRLKKKKELAAQVTCDSVCLDGVVFTSRSSKSAHREKEVISRGLVLRCCLSVWTFAVDPAQFQVFCCLTENERLPMKHLLPHVNSVLLLGRKSPWEGGREVVLLLKHLKKQSCRNAYEFYL